MKKLLFLLTALILSLAGISQGKSQGKGQGKSKDGPASMKGKPQQQEHGKSDVQYNQKVWAGTNDGNGGKGPMASRNQPAKVREAFYRDYPGATNIVWSKYRGDWTATFGSGLWGTRTAIYHANGERKDTRSVVNRNDLPGGGSVWDKIFRRDGISPANEVVQVERPGIIDKIFRVGSVGNTAMRYLFYSSAGNQVQYSY
jgi:hypothetical protein